MNNTHCCTSTFNYYIKDGNKSCHLGGNSKLKPIDYAAFFKRKYFSAALASDVFPTDVLKESEKIVSTISTIF